MQASAHVEDRFTGTHNWVIAGLTAVCYAVLDYVERTPALGADMTLVVNATPSASTFGSHARFCSNVTVPTAQATGCTPLQNALTPLPYALVTAAISSAGHLVLALI